MKVKFIYSQVYFRHLNKFRKVERSWKEVVEIGRRFEKKYQPEINKVIDIIPELVKKPWRKQVAEVFLVDWCGPSFSHPLTLKVRRDLLLMLVILTHELLHDFYLGVDEDIEVVEEEINQNVEEVFDRLGIDVKDQLGIMWGFHKKRFSKV